MKPLLLILSFLLMTATVQSQGKVITVDNRANSGADYTSLSEAVNASTLGDTIQIHPSATGYGNCTIAKRLHLVGLGHNPAISKYDERADLGVVYLQGNCANSSIRGLDISGITTSSPADVTGIIIKNNIIRTYVTCSNSPAWSNWLIEGNIFETAYVQPFGDEWTIKNNIFDNTTGYAFQNADNTDSFLNNLVISSSGNFATNCSDPIVNNNIFILEGSTTTVNLNNSTVTFNYNLTWNPDYFTVDTLSGSFNLDNTDPGYSFAYANIADYYNNDYNVSGSAVNAGSDGTDLGVFGANFDFDVHGRPDDYPYMTGLDISNSSVPLGQNINVTFTAGKKQ